MKKHLRFLCSAGTLLAASSATAATYQWDANGATAGLGGTGSYNASNLVWDQVGTGADDGTDTAVATTASGDTLRFAGTGGAVTFSSFKNTGGIEIMSSGYSFSGASSLFFTASGSYNTNAFNLDQANALAITGSGKTLSKDGSGMLTLGSANAGLTNANTLRINAGTIALNTNGSLGTVNLAFNGGTIRSVNATAKSFSNAISILSTTSTTTLGASGTGAISLTGNLTVGTGAILADGSGLIHAATGTTLTLDAGILDLAAAFDSFNGGASGTYQLFSGDLTGSGFTGITGYDTDVWSDVSFSTGDGRLTFTAVPEPAAALLGGLGMLALMRRRRA